MDLGTLKLVSPRQKWNNESKDFTPWLAENIKHLSDAIGLELEVENIEVAAGPYSADILAKDTGTGKYVVIENQLEKTNHDHLGKAITYASVLDASTIIWVATDFTEEHKKSLDWLNDHTNEEISFYGVQVELWQIDESKPAIKFNVVSRASEAVRQAARTKATDELSEAREFQLNFWTKYRDKLANTKKIPSLHTPRPQYWFDLSLGRSNVHISCTCNTYEDTVGVRVYIGNKIANSMLPFLENRKNEIETQIGQKLQWNPYPEKRDKIIELKHVTDLSDENKVAEAIDWLIDYTIKFRNAFSPIVMQAPKAIL